MALPEAQAEPVVQEGICYALFAYDAGLAINLDESERRITALTQRAAIRHKRRAPRYFEYRPAPLRVTQEREALAVGAFSPPSPPAELYTTHAQEVARILRSERAPLSAQEVNDALGHRISFGSEDVAVIDWDGALIADRDADDVRAVLEFANVELLEMRYLDQH